jgi:hypothetical protein
MLRKEVRDADLADESSLARLDQRLPCLDVRVLARQRPVDEEQIDRLDPRRNRLSSIASSAFSRGGGGRPASR